jgi:hypothetical protein
MGAFEDAERERHRAVEEFLDWLDAHGPDLGDVPRSWVLEAWEAYRKERAA